MNKEEYKQIIKERLKGNAQKLMLEQIDNFYTLSQIKLKNPKYQENELVKLSKNSFMHGFGSDLAILEFIAQSGLINRDIETGNRDNKIAYCVSLWHLQKNIKLADYIMSYSGMTVMYNDKYVVVPYKKFDGFLEKIRNSGYWSIKAESTMETRFMPSLAKDGRQLALIINGNDKACKNLIKNNLLNDDVDIDTVLNFIHMKKQEHMEMFKKNRRMYDDKRIAYMMFGVPACMIEGILVGRRYEKNIKALARIKKALPDCYICNLDGKVIVGNK